MRWRSWFQLAFGPTESRRWNGFDTCSEACGHRSDGTHSIHACGCARVGKFNPGAARAASAIRFQWCQLVSHQNRSAATEPASGHALSQSLGSTCWTKLGGLITHRGTAAVTALHRPRCNFQHCESAVNAAGGHYAHFWSRPSFGSDRYFTNLTETFGHAGHSKVRLS
jgi:hypothetical protein